jgi:hypothetical protein
VVQVSPLQTWDEALDAIDRTEDAQPAHSSGSAGRSTHAASCPAQVRWRRRSATSRSTSPSRPATSTPPTTDRQRAHLDRLWHELRATPCIDRCANWLLYGIQPKKANAKLKPGRCKGKVHQRATLGIGGRRILISRDWSGKTLADHKHDTRAWVRALLGVTTDLDHADGQVDADTPPSASRHAWELARPNDPDVPPIGHRLLRSISERARWRAELLAAENRAAQHDASRNLSATGVDGEGEQ